MEILQNLIQWILSLIIIIAVLIFVDVTIKYINKWKRDIKAYFKSREGNAANSSDLEVKACRCNKYHYGDVFTCSHCNRTFDSISRSDD